jgi:hypothetical protein
MIKNNKDTYKNRQSVYALSKEAKQSYNNKNELDFTIDENGYFIFTRNKTKDDKNEYR